MHFFQAFLNNFSTKNLTSDIFRFWTYIHFCWFGHIFLESKLLYMLIPSNTNILMHLFVPAFPWFYFRRQVQPSASPTLCRTNSESSLAAYEHFQIWLLFSLFRQSLRIFCLTSKSKNHSPSQLAVIFFRLCLHFFRIPGRETEWCHRRSAISQQVASRTCAESWTLQKWSPQSPTPDNFC